MANDEVKLYKGGILVNSGTTFDGINLNGLQYDSMNVGVGGTVTNTRVYEGGSMSFVQGASIANGITVYNGGAIGNFTQTGGNAANITAMVGGEITGNANNLNITVTGTLVGTEDSNFTNITLRGGTLSLNGLGNTIAVKANAALAGSGTLTNIDVSLDATIAEFKNIGAEPFTISTLEDGKLIGGTYNNLKVSGSIRLGSGATGNNFDATSATIYVYSNGKTNGTDLNAGTGKEIVFSGGTSLKAKVHNFASLIGSNGAYIIGASAWGLSSEGGIHLSNGASATGVQLGNNGYMTVSEGGIASNTMVSGGGMVRVSGGTYAGGSVLSGGMASFTDDGAYGSDFNVLSGGSVIVGENARIDGVSFEDPTKGYRSGGDLLVKFRGSANDIRLDGGSALVQKGGRITDLTFWRANVTVDGYGSDFTMNSSTYLNGTGTVENVTFYGYGSSYGNYTSAWDFSHRGSHSAVAGFMNGIVYGSASGLEISGFLGVGSEGNMTSTVLSAGSISVLSGGIMSGTIISSYQIEKDLISAGTITFAKGAFGWNTTVTKSGILIAESGATINTLTGSSGGIIQGSGNFVNVTLLSGAHPFGFTHLGTDSVEIASMIKGGTVTGLVYNEIAGSGIVLSGSLYASSGATVSSAVVTAGSAEGMATLYLAGGALGSDTLIDSYGVVQVSSGGILSNGSAVNHGVVEVLRGGTAQDITISDNGHYHFYLGTNTYINNWTSNGSNQGKALLTSVIDNYSIASGDLIGLGAGGSGSALTVESGGRLVLNGKLGNSEEELGSGWDLFLGPGSEYNFSSGGTATDITVLQGGTVGGTWLVSAFPGQEQNLYESRTAYMVNEGSNNVSITAMSAGQITGVMDGGSAGYVIGGTVHVAHGSSWNGEVPGGTIANVMVGSSGLIFLGERHDALYEKDNGLGFANPAYAKNINLHYTLSAGTDSSTLAEIIVDRGAILNGGTINYYNPDEILIPFSSFRTAEVTVSGYASGVVLNNRGSMTVYNENEDHDDTYLGGWSAKNIGSVDNPNFIAYYSAYRNDPYKETVFSRSFGVVNADTDANDIQISGVVSSTVINSGGTLYLTSGAFALDVNLNYSGYAYAGMGAWLSGGTIYNEAHLTVGNGGSAFILHVQAGQASGLGGDVFVYGNVTSTTLYGRGAAMTVYNGGSAYRNVVNSEGLITVLEGGTIQQTVLSGGNRIDPVTGSAVSFGGGTVNLAGFGSDTKIFSGGVYNLNGTAAYAKDTRLFSSGIMNVNYGVAEVIHMGSQVGEIFSSGGRLNLGGSGKTISALVSSGATLNVSAGGIAERTSIFSGGSAVASVNTEAGGLTSTIISSCGVLSIKNGGAAYETLVEADASLRDSGIMQGSGGTLSFDGSAGIASMVRLSAGGLVRYTQDGSAYSFYNADIDSSGANIALITRLSGGVVNGVISSAILNGDLFIGEGGVASLTKIHDSGNITVLDGGHAVSATLPEGVMTGSSGAYISGALLGSGATLNLMEGVQAHGIVISSGGNYNFRVNGATRIEGQNFVDDGEFVRFNISGGKNIAYPQETESAIHISAGGNIQMLNGADFKSVVVSSGAILGLGSGATLSDATVQAAGGTSSVGGSDTEEITLTFANGSSVSYGSGSALTILDAGLLTIKGGSVSVGSGSNALTLDGGPSFTGGSAGYATVTVYTLENGSRVSSKVYADRVYLTEGSNSIAGGGRLHMTDGFAEYVVASQGAGIEIEGGLFTNGSVYTSDFIVRGSGVVSGGTVFEGGAFSAFDGGLGSGMTFENGVPLVISGGSVLDADVTGGTISVSGGTDFTGLFNGNAANASMTIGSFGLGAGVTLTGGDMQVIGGTVSTLHIADATAQISQDGTAYDVSIDSGAALALLAGGSADGVAVESAGSLSVDSDAFLTNGTVSVSGTAVISGGSVSVFQIAGGETTVSGGTLTGGTIFGGTTGEGSAASVTDGILNLSSGGFANEITVNQNGSLTIGGSAVASAVLISGGFTNVSGTEGAAAILSGGSVSAGLLSIGEYGSAMDALFFGGTTTVSGATALLQNANLSGGVVNVTGSALASAGNQFAGTMTISDSATADDMIISGGLLTIETNGSALNPDIVGGTVEILSAGTVTNAHISGSITGEGSTAVITSGVLNVKDGGFAQSASIGSTGLMTLSGTADHIASGSDITVGSDGILTVSSGAKVTHLTVSGGSADIAGGIVTSGDMEILAGSMIVRDSGSAMGGIIGSSGVQIVSDGGYAEKFQVLGSQIALGSGLIRATTVSSGGLVTGEGLLQDLTMLSGARVQNGSAIYTHIGGSNANIEILSGGTIMGSANTFLEVEAGDVLVGGTVGSFTIHGASVDLLSGTDARAYNTIISAGSMNIGSNAKAYSTIISAGAMNIGEGAYGSGGTIFGGEQNIVSGGSAENFLVSGNQNIAAGGSAFNIIVGASGAVINSGAIDTLNVGESGTLDNAGYAVNVSMGSGGRITGSGGIFERITLSESATFANGNTSFTHIGKTDAFVHSATNGEFIGSGNKDIVYDAGTIFVGNAGTITNFTQSNGYMELMADSNAVANDTKLFGGSMNVGSTGKALGGTIALGATQNVLSGGSAKDFTVAGVQTVELDGTVGSTTVLAGGSMTGLGFMDDATVQTGGFVSNGSTFFTQTGSNAAFLDAVSNGVILGTGNRDAEYAAGSVFVGNAGTITSFTQNGGYLELTADANAFANNTDVFGGSMNIGSTGKALGGTIALGATQNVLSGGSAKDFAVAGVQTVELNGTVGSTTVLAGGSMTGLGFMDDATVQNGGFVSNGSTFFTQTGSNAAFLDAVSNGVILGTGNRDAEYAAGSVYVGNAGSITNFTQNAGYLELTANANAFANNTDVFGGSMNVSATGSAFLGSVGVGATQNVFANATAEQFTVEGLQTVELNGTVGSTTVLAGGSMTGLGFMDDATVQNGGFISNGSTFFTQTGSNAAFLDAVSNGVILGTGNRDAEYAAGSVYVGNAGSITNFTQNAGYLELMAGSNAFANDTKILGGSMNVGSTGKALGGTIALGATQNVFDGGTVAAFYVNGTQNISAGAYGSGMHIGSTGRITNSGLVENTIIEGSGVLADHETAKTVMVLAGGTLTGLGFMDDATIQNGGFVSNGSTFFTQTGSNAAFLDAVSNGVILGSGNSNAEYAVGSVYVGSAGTITNFTQTDGYMEIMAGSNAFASDTKILGGVMNVSATGSAFLGSVGVGATQNVFANATAEQFTVEGLQTVELNGTVGSTTVLAGGSMTGLGFMDDATVQNGGFVSNGSTFFTQTGSAAFLDAVSNGVILGSGNSNAEYAVGSVYVGSAGTITNFTQTNGYMELMAGSNAFANDTKILGGSMNVSATGSAFLGSVGVGATQNVFANATAEQFDVAGVQTVELNGTVGSTTVLDGGSMTGLGFMDDATVQTGGFVSNGSTFFTQTGSNAAFLDAVSNGVILGSGNRDAEYADGSVYVGSAGTITNFTQTNGYMELMAGSNAFASDTKILGGVMNVSATGSAFLGSVGVGATQNVFANATAEQFTVEGLQTVELNGTVGSTTVLAGGSMTGLGFMDDATVQNGGFISNGSTFFTQTGSNAAFLDAVSNGVILGTGNRDAEYAAGSVYVGNAGSITNFTQNGGYMEIMAGSNAFANDTKILGGSMNVSATGSASLGSVGVGATQNVFANATAEQFTVAGVQTVELNGTVGSTTVLDGGSMTGLGFMDDATIQNGGFVSNGSTFFTQTGSAAFLDAVSNGVILGGNNHDVQYTAGSVFVGNAGTITDFTQTNGYMELMAGSNAVASDTKILGGVMNVSSTGLAIGGTVGVGATQNVFANATAEQFTVEGLQTVALDGTVRSTTVLAGGTLTGLGFMDDVTVRKGGFVSNGSTFFTQIGSVEGFLDTLANGVLTGTSNKNVNASAGTIHFASGAEASSFTMTNGDLIVNAGAIVRDTTMLKSGVMDVAGQALGGTIGVGVVQNILENGTGSGFVVYGTQNVESGAYAGKIVAMGGAVVNNSGSMSELTVSANGSLAMTDTALLDNLTFCKGGTVAEFVNAGNNTVTIGKMSGSYVTGLMNSLTVNGILLLGSGADAKDTDLRSGVISATSGAYLSGTTIQKGTELNVAGGTVNDTTVSAGTFYMNSSATGTEANLNRSALMTLEGTGVRMTSTLIGAGATQYVLSGALSEEVEILSGGSQIVDLAGSAASVTVSKGAVLDVGSKAFATDVTLLTGGTVAGYIHAGNGDVKFDKIYNGYIAGSVTGRLQVSGNLSIGSGAHVTSTLVENGGILHILSSAIAEETLVSSNGTVLVSNGGTANGVQVLNEGVLSICKGGLVQGAEILLNGQAYVQSGGTGINISLGLAESSAGSVSAYGRMRVSNGGIVSNTIVNSAGYLYLYKGAEAEQTTVSYGGRAWVSSGALLQNTLVESDGGIWLSGGTAVSAVLNSGAWMHVSSGGKAADTIVESGGSLLVYKGGTVAGTATTLKDGALMTIAGSGNLQGDVWIDARDNASIGVIRAGTDSKSSITASTATIHVDIEGREQDNGQYEKTNYAIYNLYSMKDVTVDVQVSATQYFGEYNIEMGTEDGDPLSTWFTVSVAAPGGYVTSERVQIDEKIVIGDAIYTFERGSYGVCLSIEANTEIDIPAMELTSGQHVARGATMFTHAGENVASIGGITADGMIGMNSGVVVSDYSPKTSAMIALAFGGTTKDFVLEVGNMSVSSGASALNTIVSSGRLSVSFGGYASGGKILDVASSAELMLMGGGTVTDFEIYGNALFAAGGSASEVMIGKNGVLSNAANISSVKILSGGSLTNRMYTTYGTANDITMSSGAIVDGFQHVGTTAASIEKTSSGVLYGSITGLAISGAAILGRDASAQDTVLAGGSLTAVHAELNDTVLSGGTMIVRENTVASNTQVKSGAAMTLLLSGSGIDTVVSNGGLVNVQSTGILKNTTVEAGGQIVMSGVSAALEGDTILSNCTVLSGGTVNETILLHSGRAMVGGIMLEEDAILSAGVYGGTVYAVSGGRSYDGTVEMTGLLTVSGLVNVDSTASIRMDLRGRSAAWNEKANSISYVENFNAIPNAEFHVTISADQKFGQYCLGTSAMNFTGSVSINAESTRIGTVSLTEYVISGETLYSLENDMFGRLYLSISDVEASSIRTDLLSNGVSQIAAQDSTGAVGFFATDGKNDPEWNTIQTVGQTAVAAGRFSGSTVLQDGILLYDNASNMYFAWTDLNASDLGKVELCKMDGVYETKGLGNFGGDIAYDDILAVKADGSFGIVSDGTVYHQVSAADATCKVLAAGSFGKESILTYNTADSHLYLWSDPDSDWKDWRKTDLGVLDSDWTVAATGDFSGDGTDDIVLWRKSTGEVAIRENGQLSGQRTTGFLDDSNWEIAGVGDYNGDGSEDLLLRETATGHGNLAVWGGAEASQLIDVNAEMRGNGFLIA